MMTTTDVDEILAQVSKYLRDQLPSERLSSDVEKSRKQLLELLDKYLKEKNSYKAILSTKESRSSLEVQNWNENVGSKRESKCLEHVYERNFMFVRGDNQSDSCDESDHGSPEDRQSLASDQSDRRLDSNRHSKRISKIKNDSEFVGRNYEGYLYKKGKLNSWTKLFCIIYEKWIVCYTKDSKQLQRIDLEGYEATVYRSRDNHKYEYELRLSGPGLKSYNFNVKDKVEADLWATELTKAIDKAKSNSLKSSSSINNNNKEESENLPMNSICSLEATSTEQGQSNVSQSKPSIFHNLINKVKQKAMAAFDSLESLNEKYVSGLLHVTMGDLSKPTWIQRFCTIKHKHLEVYRNHGNDMAELSLPLSGIGLTLIPSGEYFVLCLNQAGQKMFIKFSNHAELNKWYQSLQRESLVLPEVPQGSGTLEDVSLYDEIGEFRSAHPKVPECPPPMTPDVTGALMNMEEVGYMDALHCRQPITSTFRNTEENVTYEEVSMYVNRDGPDNSMATVNDINVTKPYYCPMSRGNAQPVTGKQSQPSTGTKSTTSLPPANTIKSKIASTTPKSTKMDPTPSTTTITPTVSSSSAVNASKRISDFEELRGKFLQSSTTSATKNDQQSMAPAPNKWVTPLARNTSSIKAEDASITSTQGGDDVDCLMRKSKANRTSNRTSTPDGNQRNSDCSGKSSRIQEKMKIFQNI